MPRISSNTALLIDAIGCFAGAALLVFSATIWGFTGLPTHWRLPVAVSLFVFSVLLVVAARYPVRPWITAAVLGNIAWIIAGGIAIAATDSPTGAIIIALVMVAAAIMAWLQAKGFKARPVVAHNNI